MNNPFTHLFDKYVLKAYYVPSTCLGAGQTAVNRTMSIASQRLHSKGFTLLKSSQRKL